MDKRYAHFYKDTNGNRQKKRASNAKINKEIRKKKLWTVGLFVICFLVVLGAVVVTFRHFYRQMQNGEIVKEEKPEPELIIPELTGVAEEFPDLPITEAFLTVNRYSRPGIALSSTPQYIVIHYTANPGTTGWDNRNYFENLKDSGQTFASAQFVVGLDGQIIQCVPCNEMAYCSNSYNEFCISIENCHPDESGNFNDETYNNLVYLVAHLMNYYHLDMDRLIRHYDITGKNCPKYFVEHSDRWSVFKGYVEEYREKFKNEDEALFEQKLKEMREQDASE